MRAYIVIYEDFTRVPHICMKKIEGRSSREETKGKQAKKHAKASQPDVDRGRGGDG